MSRTRAVCPNDPTHKEFITVAHVAEEWVVDPEGNWVETLQCTETVARPHPGNDWACRTCGALATFEQS